jgi:hypothetical protein
MISIHLVSFTIFYINFISGYLCDVGTFKVNNLYVYFYDGF